ncbi:FAD-dependent monooxygenase [Streptomyces scabiei]|uniref:Lct41 n=1 Tax=Streptomyces rishiriensis TaxID=68264 RepID=B0LJ24_STRRH|nr:FAD-dependent monooxygenase [Streptomyces scabiei]ABX71124.1 Lct41 [Streptomyces rishiriensis]MDX3117000.1 FAD-dependent oxidoreductase [Streptomyces scabiei]
MADVQVPVLVVGGGMSGLASALFLRQQGIDCLVVERNSGVSQMLRSTHVSPRTMELFRTLGIEQGVLDVAEKFVLGKHWADRDLPPHHLPRAILRAQSLAHIVEGDVVVMAEGENDFHDIGPSEAVWCGQDKVEPVMLEEALRLGAQISFRTELTSFVQDEDGVTAQLRDLETGRTSTVRARYLIAADGAHSPLRKELGIERNGHGALGHVLNILFTADIDSILDGRRFMILYLQNRDAPGMLFKVDDERWIYGIFGDPRVLDASKVTPEECVDLVRKATGVPGLEVNILEAKGWWIGHGIADAYRAGRVFLVGDSAHVLPPTGGFGANCGVQDAQNLAWKLAGVLRGWAGEGLLDTYETERRPVGRATIDQAWMRHMRWSDPQDADERDEREQTIVTTAYRYTSPVIPGTDFDDPLSHELVIDGRPGMRVPHTWLTDARGERVSPIDLTGESFLLFTGDQADDRAERALAAADELGVPLKVHRLVADGDVRDPHDEFRKASGIGAHGALLVRPDGFVAWRRQDAEGAEGAETTEHTEHTENTENFVDILAAVTGRTL